MPPDFYQIMDLQAKKLDTFQTLWSLYITVVLGFLAYLAAAPNSSRSQLVRVVLMGSFACFAVVNYWGLEAVRAQRAYLAAAADKVLARECPQGGLPEDPPAGGRPAGPPPRRDVLVATPDGPGAALVPRVQ